jgi:immune inhibitor A
MINSIIATNQTDFMDVQQRLILLLISIMILAGTTANPLVSAASDDTTQIIASRPMVRDRIALAEAFGIGIGLPRVARTTPLNVRVGDTERFWISDQTNAGNRQITARLRYAGPHVLMYVDTTLNPPQALIEQAAKQFEEQIYPRNRTLFGKETAPGIDGDARLTVLNTTISGAGGYFSPDDAVIKAINRFSNERDMFVIDINSYPIGTDGYLATLAHEFQHMIHESRGPGAATWFDEGLASLAEDLNGYVDQNQPQLFLRAPDMALTDWESTSANYGMARLFMRYIYDQYAGQQGLQTLITQDAGDSVQAFVKLAAARRPDIRSFSDLFADWAVATLLNNPNIGDGRYTYRLYAGKPRSNPVETQTNASPQRSSVAQFGIDYLTLNGPVTLDFDGNDSVLLAGTMPAEGRYVWWSHRGDQQVATLTRELDLRKVTRATLRFKARYEIERDYDYAFVSISSDNGKTWQTLASTSTTTDDPQGANYGNGFTGISGVPGADIHEQQRGRWVEEQADMSNYAGKKVLLRFWSISDAALNGTGLLLDDLRVPEIDLRDGFEQANTAWVSQGFVRVTGELRQNWALRLVRYGITTTVEKITLDTQGRTQIQLAKGEKAVLVVIGTTPYTSEQAEYTLNIATSR